MPTPDLGAVLSAATEYGDQREAAARAELQPQIDAAETERDRVRAAIAELRAEYDEHMATAHPVVEPPPDPKPEPTIDLVELTSGTWVLQQVPEAVGGNPMADLKRLRPKIEAALALPGIVGLSIRFPWNQVDLDGTTTTHQLLDLARTIAGTKQLAIRFMAGRHTPKRVFDAGASRFTTGGKTAPLPWDDASGKVQVFLDAYDAYVGKLADWCRANDVHLLHGSWFALDWAELNHGKEVRAVAGYTQDKWMAGHKALINVLCSHRAPDLAVELPLSGYGPLSGGQSAALADHIVSIVGENSDQFFIQANGWDDTRQWGAPDAATEAQFDAIWKKPLNRGVQMIQPQDYDWPKVYAQADAAGATYGEVYLPSFSAAHAAQLRDQIAAFKA